MSQAYERQQSAATFHGAWIGVLVMAWALSARADDGSQFYGLLRSRDLSPFGFCASICARRMP
jgi:hypothetical protein